MRYVSTYHLALHLKQIMQ